MFIQAKEPINSLPPPEFFQDNTLIDIFQKPTFERSIKELNFLLEFLDKVSVLKQASKEFTDYQDFLIKCSERLKYQKYLKGAPLVYKGQKYDEFIIIIKGKVNVYDTKYQKQITRQFNRTWSSNNTTQSHIKKPKAKELARRAESKESHSNSSKSSFKHTSSVINIKQTENEVIFPCVDSSPQDNKSSPSNFEEKEHNYDHFSIEEKLLLENKEAKKKYIKDSSCLLYCLNILEPGNTINDMCFEQEMKSKFTFIAAEDIETVIITAQDFQEMSQTEFELQGEKRKYFSTFFGQIGHFSNIFLTYLVEKTYNINDKIYEANDEADGLYFIKSGEVKFCTVISDQESPMPSKDSLDQEDKNLFEKKEVSPLRKEIIGTEWLRGPRKSNNISRENLPGFRTQIVKKEKAIVGVIGEGNSFGEEGLFSDEKKRYYTTFAATNQLIIYFLSSKYYSTIQILYPNMAKILVEKSKSQNSWLDDRVKEMKGVQEMVGNVYHPQQKKIVVDFLSRPYRYSNKIRERISKESMAALIHSKKAGNQNENKIDEVEARHQGFLKIFKNMTEGQIKGPSAYLKKKVSQPVLSFSQLKREISPISKSRAQRIKKPTKVGKEGKDGSFGEERLSYLKRFYNGIHKKGLSSRDKTEFSNTIETIIAPFSERAKSLIVQELLDDNNSISSPILPSKFIRISSPVSRVGSPDPMDRSEKKQDVSFSLTNKPSMVLPTLEFALISKDNSLPPRGSFSSDNEKDMRKTTDSIDQVDFSYKSPSRDKTEVNWHLGSLTERKSWRPKPPVDTVEERSINSKSTNSLLKRRSYSKSPIERSQVDNENGNKKGTKKRILVSSLHNMFRLKPKRPIVFGHIYKLQPPQTFN